MAESSPHSLRMLDRLALAIFLIVGVVGLGWLIWRKISPQPVADPFDDIEKVLAQRRIVEHLPAPDQADAAHHALRLARLEVQLARAKAVDAQIAELAARFAELQKWTLDQLDQENRARLDRRLHAIETDPVLRAAQATYQQRRDTIPPQATAAAEARLQQAERLLQQVYGVLDQAVAQAAATPASKSARSEQCVQCHRGIDRAELDRASLGKLADPEESKRLSMRLSEVRDLLARRALVDPNTPSSLQGVRLGSVWLVVALMLLSTVVAAVSLGLLERSWRVGLNATYVGLVLSLLTGAALATLTPAPPRVEPVPLSQSEIKQYCVHPRLDLYVGANSPHPASTFACADCHHGQGKATRFGPAGHQPNDIESLAAWNRDHGWKPEECGPGGMLATRFTQAACLKCHTQVTDTIRYGVQEEAPKLLAGQRLFQQLGCQGCHEVQGPVLDPRPVGPSLRRVAEKVDEAWLRRWIAEPRSFREHTLMPHFYGLSNNHPDVLPPDQKAFPAVEIAAIGNYLRSESERASQGNDSTSEQLRQNWQRLYDRLTKVPSSSEALQAAWQLAEQLREHARRQQPLAVAEIDDTHRRLDEVFVRLRELPVDAPDRLAW
ncbi:MAG: hypothetical protein SNJ75_11145, partial [Gemmataceae bacterium]